MTTREEYVKAKRIVEEYEAETPLITTAVGDEIFHGQQYWQVDDKFRIWSYEALASCDYGNYDPLRYHSSEEKAIKWLVQHMPVITMEDIKMLVPCPRSNMLPIAKGWIERRVNEHLAEHGILGTMGRKIDQDNHS